VHRLIEELDGEISHLGPERLKPSQTRIFLTQVSVDFQSLVKDSLVKDSLVKDSLVKDGLEGIYDARGGTFFSKDSSIANRRLRAAVHMENEKFAEFMRVHCQQRRVVSDPKGGQSTLESFSHSISGLTGKSSNFAAQPNEKAQGEELLVTKKQMLAWVKHVRSKSAFNIR
jgi:hypothetical protein